ncbi:DUF4382 domain-containing protein [Shewanella amazonensis]
MACGESNTIDGNHSPTIPASGNQAGTLSIDISDSPMSGVVGVIIQLNELVMTDELNNQHRYSLKDRKFNLLDYQGKKSIRIVDGLSVPTGNYHDVHMTVIAGDGNNGCYVEDGQGIHPMQVQEGVLPLMNFSVSANQHQSFTMEIGLYLGLNHDDDHNYTLRHHGSWSVDNHVMGHLLGEMDPQWIADCETANAVMLPASGSFSHLAYLYPDSVNSLAQMGDMHDSTPEGHVAPIAVAPLRQDTSGHWFFEMGYLPEGMYRVGYSCLGNLDNPHADDIQHGSFSMFADAGFVRISAGVNGGTETVMQCGNGNGGHHGG